MIYLKPFWEWSNMTASSCLQEETDKGISLKIKLPGIKKENIELKYLSSGAINVTVISDGDVLVNQDIYPQRQIDPEGIEAKLDLGVLTITAPVLNTDKIIRIE